MRVLTCLARSVRIVVELAYQPADIDKKGKVTDQTVVSRAVVAALHLQLIQPSHLPLGTKLLQCDPLLEASVPSVSLLNRDHPEPKRSNSFSCSLGVSCICYLPPWMRVRRFQRLPHRRPGPRKPLPLSPCVCDMSASTAPDLTRQVDMGSQPPHPLSQAGSSTLTLAASFSTLTPAHGVGSSSGSVKTPRKAMAACRAVCHG